MKRYNVDGAQKQLQEIEGERKAAGGESRISSKCQERIPTVFKSEQIHLAATFPSILRNAGRPYELRKGPEARGGHGCIGSITYPGLAKEADFVVGLDQEVSQPVTDMSGCE